MSSRLGPVRCLAVWARVDVETNSSGPMSSGAISIDVEASVLGPMSSRLGPGRFQVVWARADFGSSWPGLMSSRSSPDRCRVVQTQDVE